MRNNDDEASVIPPFRLVDDRGAQHSEALAGSYAENALGTIEQLNPTVAKQGVVVFDVPPDRTYRLKVSGGYLSGAFALIDLSE